MNAAGFVPVQAEIIVLRALMGGIFLIAFVIKHR
ncbi:UNVERIFIED_ORG: hypothetical protein J2X79_003848 [Arthrobacter globiformis]|nr:hypothetical protein [Arthrobacter globiformis]